MAGGIERLEQPVGDCDVDCGRGDGSAGRGGESIGAARAQIALALAAADDVTDRHRRISRAAELAVERARYEADQAERAFCQVDQKTGAVTTEHAYLALITPSKEPGDYGDGPSS